MRRLPVFVVFIGLAAGCQSAGWARLDGARVDESGLERARTACRFERKLGALEHARDVLDAGLRQASTNQGKMLVREDFAAVERQVYREIDTCMRKQGYARKD